MMISGDQLDNILAILRNTDGYFVLRDKAGQEYVIARREAFDQPAESVEQMTLSLPTAAMSEASADDVLERINQDLASYYMQQLESEEGDLDARMADQAQDEGAGEERPAPRRVRFEPIRGDISPDLQE